MAKGFTLIEALISLGLLGAIAGLSIAFGIDAYRRAGAGNAAEEVRTLLVQARADAIAGIGASAHGVCMVGASLELYEAAPGVIERTLPVDAEARIEGLDCAAGGVSFAAYSATTTTANIAISFDGAVSTVIVNAEGGIE
jgi:type II secretory pathway pseudopilin PulG